MQADRRPPQVSGVCRVWYFINRFLTVKESLRDTGKLSSRSFRDYDKACERIAGHFGRERLVSDIRVDDLEAYRAVIAEGRGLPPQSQRRLRCVASYSILLTTMNLSRSLSGLVRTSAAPARSRCGSLRRREAELMQRLSKQPSEALRTAEKLLSVRESICAATGQQPHQLAFSMLCEPPFAGCETACQALVKRLPEIGTLHIVSSDDFSDSQLRVSGEWRACSGPRLAEQLQEIEPGFFPTVGVAVAFNVSHPTNRGLTMMEGLGIVVHELSHAFGVDSHNTTFVLATCLIHHRARLRSIVPLSQLGVGYGAVGNSEDLFVAYSELFSFFRETASLPVREIIRQVEDLERRPPQGFFDAARTLTH